MSSFSFLVLLFSLIFIPSISQAQSPRAIYIDCGANVSSVINGRTWLPDAGFITAGTSKTLTTPVLLPTLSTVRSFPLAGNVNKKFCYVVQVYHPARYMVRTTYFYGGINGNDVPPVFDQIVDGTFWSVVDTVNDYARNFSSYYEGVFATTGKTMSVCVGGNQNTTSDPFISALELVILGNSVYNSTNFTNFGLSLVARHSFGYNGPIIQFPDDQFDRFWEPFGESNSSAASNPNITVSGFWNLPPLKIFQTQLENIQPVAMEIQWPPSPLVNSTYYIALYFAEGSPQRTSRAFDISINGVNYYRNLNVTRSGAAVFSTKWPLAGPTQLTLTPSVGSDVGPVINGGEVFKILPLEGRTNTRDVIGLEGIKASLQNYPIDWNGDPCLPSQYAWTGVTCSLGSRIRVISLNLTSMGLSGSISPNIANLTALTNIWLGTNNISGPIPDLSALRRLEILHLENNKLIGDIPPSLATISTLREIYLQNNDLTGVIPTSLTSKPGLTLQTLPGNNFTAPPPSQP